MTNEEFTEEIYYEAFNEGYIDELRTRISSIDTIKPGLPHWEKVQLAYYSLKNPSSLESGSALATLLQSKGVNI